MTDHPAPRQSVAQIMNPTAIAFVGASEDLRKFGGRIFHNTVTGGFPGIIVPVNPRRERLLDLPCVPLVSAAPQRIDVAVIAVPRELVLDHVRDCAEARVACCVLITAGFTETGPEGAALEQEILATARAHGMRLIGPNCLGLINTHARLIMNSSPSMQETAHIPGGIGFISQSGALMATVYNRGVGDGARFSSAISVGNQADLELADFMEWMAQDEATRCITLYVEGFKNPARFVAAARTCREAGKPVLMVKSGRSEEGARVTMSHTASLAGSWRVLEAVCREAGVVPVDDINGMMQAAEMIARYGKPSGDGICVVSGSGGAAAITTDRFEDVGLRLAQFSSATRTKLEEIYEPQQLGNPLDLGAMKSRSFVDIDDGGLATAAADPDVAANLLMITTAPQLTEATRALAAAGKATGKPTLVVFQPGNAADGAREAVRDLDLLHYETSDEALRVLQCWLVPRDAAPEAVRPEDLPGGDPFAGCPSGWLAEHETKEVLARYGIRATRERPVHSAREAVMAAREIGWPVALKGFGPDLIHKSDEGAVALSLRDEMALQTAWDLMARRLGTRLAGALVAEMAGGEAEAILGIQHDPQFGPVVLVGLGGVLAEVLDDIVLIPAPASPERVKALLPRLRLWPLLAGVRGGPALDIDALADAAARLSWLAVDAGARLAELDINPLFLRRQGEGVIAVDARARLT
jgi:acyl-CoA synthetase (NDP forming)